MSTIATLILTFYIVILFILSLYGLHRYWILYLYYRYYKWAPPLPRPSQPAIWPKVTVQLPIFNEQYVVKRLINRVCDLDYPRDCLEVQVLDDSTDETTAIAQATVAKQQAAGVKVHYLHRPNRVGFKAGALAEGVRTARGEFIAVFDADFVPPPTFLKDTIPHFQDPQIGMVQTRWSHLNADYSLLTRIQALFLDGHFVLEHTARNRSGAFFNFNGTAGVWRRSAIESAGGWQHDTLTEDLDLSYRAQLAGWRFLFLPEVICPAELPVDVHAFKSQQHRWTKGAMQTAKKLLPKIWRSDLSLSVKLEATVHLTANVGYLLMAALALLVGPALWIRHLVPWSPYASALELGAFLSTSFSIVCFYLVTQSEVSPGKPWRLRDLPALMSLGIGMCLNNAKGVWQALCGYSGEFCRTAKYRIESARDDWKHKRYRSMQGRLIGGEALFCVYSLLACGVAVGTANWVALPFSTLFLIGFAYVAVLSAVHADKGT
ncbi:MAG: glycosyltransferase [Elusimicrobia bacterium]|nr:glycosyltransferase [Elusimicrobiota bacterium]